jgi:hypothetical protein
VLEPLRKGPDFVFDNGKASGLSAVRKLVGEAWRGGDKLLIKSCLGSTGRITTKSFSNSA